MTIYGRSKLTHRFTTKAGSPVTMVFWNPTIASLAKSFDCDEDEVDISEDETGDERVTVRGQVVGVVEWM